MLSHLKRRSIAIFPYDDCPTAWDLEAFFRGKLSEINQELTGRVRDHVAMCVECSAAGATIAAAIGGMSRRDDPKRSRPSGTGAEEPREMQLQRGWQNSSIQPGEIWMTTLEPIQSPDFFYGLEIPIIVINVESAVLDSDEHHIVVAPITHDVRLAAEWSFVLAEGNTDMGIPLVIHLDWQFSIDSSRFRNVITSVSDEILVELRAHAADYWDYVRLPLQGLTQRKLVEQAGYMGDFIVRDEPAWYLQCDYLEGFVKAAALMDGAGELGDAAEEDTVHDSSAADSGVFGDSGDWHVLLGGKRYRATPSPSNPRQINITGLRIGKLKAILNQLDAEGKQVSLRIHAWGRDIEKTASEFDDVTPTSSERRLAAQSAISGTSGSENSPIPTILRASLEDGRVMEVLSDGTSVELKLI